MTAILAMASGGALGAVARYVSAGWVQNPTDGFFPWGTFPTLEKARVVLYRSEP